MAIGDLDVVNTIYAANGRGRLKLVYVRVTDDTGANFHSLVWERRTAQEWAPHHTLSQDDFEWQHLYHRWVSDVHSLSPNEGTAIIKIAESTRPKCPPQGFSVIYSWRIWDLLNNRELKKVRECEPFEKYDES